MLVLNNTKWNILKELSKENQTPTALAKKLKITLPSLHKQLKELESNHLIKKTGDIKGKTRPYSEYSIETGFIYITKVLPNETAQTFLQIDENLKFHLRIWSIPQKEYHYYVESFWWQLQPCLKDIDSIIIYGSVAKGNAKEGSDIDILLLVNKDIKKYEKKFSVFRIKNKDNAKMIMSQIFRTEDFKNSIKKSSDFATEVINSNIIIYDPNNVFRNLKNEEVNNQL